jgi:2-amino-4-hydroxy-6-hydroxymethyldihydropteridine diphosphokinase
VSAAAESPPPAPAYLGLGTNLGDRRANLSAAVNALPALGTIVRISDVYESDAVGYVAQPHFWNLAVLLMTKLTPGQLLAAVKDIEAALGRVPTFRMGPRLIDIDLLLYDQEVIDTATLQLPHPGMLERAFVLWPLIDINPELRDPVTGVSLQEVARRLDTAGTVSRLGSAGDILPEW